MTELWDFFVTTCAWVFSKEITKDTKGYLNNTPNFVLFVSSVVKLSSL
jgi:hypothetical protein